MYNYYVSIKMKKEKEVQYSFSKQCQYVIDLLVFYMLDVCT